MLTNGPIVRRTIAVLGVVGALLCVGLLVWAQSQCLVFPCERGNVPLAVNATPPRASATSTPLPSATATLTATVTAQVVPYGAVQSEDGSYVTPTPKPRWVNPAQLIELYGGEGYPNVAAMPSDLAYYVDRTLRELSLYFEVPEEALLALWAARNDGEFQIASRDDEGKLIGAAQLSPRLWNGWAAPNHESYLNDVHSIEQYGGLGFDWAARYSWQNWVNNRSAYALQYSFGSDAAPTDFDDNMAALARYLLREGVTTEVARRQPTLYQARLVEAVKAFSEQDGNGRPLAAPLANPLSNEALAPIHRAFQDELARRFGVRLSEADLQSLVDGSVSAEALSTRPVDDLTAELVEQFVSAQFDAAQAAIAEERPLPWPYLQDEQYLAVQERAVALVGHTLAPWEIALLLDASDGDPAALDSLIYDGMGGALYAEATAQVDEALQRSARGLPLRNYEVTSLLQAAVNLSQSNRWWTSSRQQVVVLGTVEQMLRRTDEYRQIHGDLFFSAQPYDPMPNHIIQPFGVPASYEPSGYHSGLDIRGERTSAQQPTIHAVEAGTVVHVGPLYCLVEGKCRGAHAVVIDHGDNVYTTYSHNSAALVTAGEVVAAGQAIALQGNEGYSRGPHLHLEVHLDAPFSGDWTTPWYGGRFVDPWPWLPVLGTE